MQIYFLILRKADGKILDLARCRKQEAWVWSDFRDVDPSMSTGGWRIDSKSAVQRVLETYCTGRRYRASWSHYTPKPKPLSDYKIIRVTPVERFMLVSDKDI